jgi:hypothetical protein
MANNIYYESTGGDTHPDGIPPLMEADSDFYGFADVTWDRDGFAIDLASLIGAGHTLTLTLDTLGDSFSGLQVQWAIVSWDTYVHGDPPRADPYASQNLFGGIFDLGEHTAQQPPGTDPVSGVTQTIQLPALSAQPNVLDRPVLIIDIFSAGVFLSDFGPMVQLDYHFGIKIDGGGGGGGGGGPPDYTAAITDISSVSAKAGDSLKLTYQWENHGGAGFGVRSNEIYLSTDSNVDTNDILLASHRSLRSALADALGNPSQTINETITLPSNLAPGTYYIGAITDSKNAIDESDETNNVSAPVAITITGSNTYNGHSYGFVLGFVPDANIVGKAFFIWLNLSELGRFGTFR